MPPAENTDPLDFCWGDLFRQREPRSMCWWCSAPVSPPSPLLHRMWSAICLLHDTKHVERKGQDGCLVYRSLAVRRDEPAGVSCPSPCRSGGCQHLTWISLCVPSVIRPGLLFVLFVWGQRRTTRPRCQRVYAAAGCTCACTEEVWTQGEHLSAVLWGS